jgi:hypothetical protein
LVFPAYRRVIAFGIDGSCIGHSMQETAALQVLRAGITASDSLARRGCALDRASLPHDTDLTRCARRL